MNLKTRFLLYSAILFGLLPASAANAAPIRSGDLLELQDLGVGYNPKAINNNGQIVGQGPQGVAFLWDNGNYSTLGTLGGSQSFANDINDVGTIVGWSFNSQGKQRAVKWESPTTGLIDLDQSALLEGAAESINESGLIVGWQTGSRRFYSTIWDGTSPNGSFLFQTHGNQKALSINDHGEVAGVFLKSDLVTTDRGYYWDGIDRAQFTYNLDLSYAPLGGINNFKTTAGRWNESLASFFKIGFEPGEFVVYGTGPSFPNENSIALAINDLGQVVGEKQFGAFIFEVDSQSLHYLMGFQSRNLQYDSITRLTDINDQGQFVGTALINGQMHGVTGKFIAVPEPSTLGMLTLALSDLVIWLLSSGKEKGTRLINNKMIVSHPA